MSSNNREIKRALYYRESFDGNSAHGYRLDSDGERHGQYVVRSYHTDILRYDLTTHTVTYFDNRYYSVTTSRIQNMIRDAFPTLSCSLFDSRVVYDSPCAWGIYDR